MAETTMTRPTAAIMPEISINTVLSVIVAGALATAAFDLVGQVISPFTGNSALAPVGLAQGTWNTVFGDATKAHGYMLHLIAGLIAYPAGWLFFWEPVQRRVMPGLHWTLSSAIYGAVLWVFALYVMAHLVVGMPAFLNFSNITWVALVGHVVFGVVAAAGLRLRVSL
ncbi:MAG: hypothetical protein AAF577_02670 [Pseudomonadota bacterium]